MCWIPTPISRHDEHFDTILLIEQYLMQLWQNGTFTWDQYHHIQE